MDFDNEKQREAARRLLKRLSIGGINDQQALFFMENHTEYTDERGFKSFLKKVKKSDSFPVKKKGEELVRTDLGGKA
jgi:hypothetical protein